jgi:hypothetical protein
MRRTKGRGIVTGNPKIQPTNQPTNQLIKNPKNRQCDRLTERWPHFCSERGHRVRKVPAKKRFFVCANAGCGGQASLVGPGMHPKEACSRCGERLWRVRGKGSAGGGGGGEGEGGKGGGLARPVPAIADWNRYDGSVDGLFA